MFSEVCFQYCRKDVAYGAVGGVVKEEQEEAQSMQTPACV